MTDALELMASEHLVGHLRALLTLQREQVRLRRWGVELADRLQGGGRLLVAGNGGSAAEAQHLAAELVGRFRRERPGLSAIALHAETSSLTAIANDYGYVEAFARQVQAHGRAGDVLLCLSTSGASPNLLAAARAARAAGLRTWALTGATPNPLRDACDGAVCIDHASTAVVQEVHLVAIHLLCEVVDAICAEAAAAPPIAKAAG
jgi:D-sedoheptulose 7-phosphate isomerase